MNYYSVAARLLADRHVPFDVILLGYPRESLFDDAAQLERLRSGRSLCAKTIGRREVRGSLLRLRHQLHSRSLFGPKINCSTNASFRHID